MFYLDTSVVVAAFIPERTSGPVQRWLARQKSELLISDWVVTEFSSALSNRIRRQDLSPESRAEALAGLAKAMIERLSVVPIARSAFATATRWVDQAELGLRAADALHAAVAAEHGATLCTLDIRLQKACSTLGVKAIGIGVEDG